MLELRWAQVKRFRDVAWKHFEAAQYLLRGCSPRSASTRAAEAIYLGGYAAECILKARLLSRVRPKRHSRLLEQFKSRFRHDLEAQREALQRGKKPVHLPEEEMRSFRRIRRTWSSTLRYDPGMKKTEDAEVLLESVFALLQWVLRR
ncbi:MAG: HEPN domain-containing protein [Gemmataceae bacterium]